MLAVRRIGLVILAVAAVGVYFLLEPDDPDLPSSIPDLALGASDYADLVDQALADFEANEERADSAPQQQVVAGWVARDLLAVIALEGAQNVSALDVLAEQNEQIFAALTTPEQRDNRPAALLTLGVIAIALWGATSLPPDARVERLEPSDSQEGSSFLGSEERHSDEPTGEALG